jgi:hypothetical protein
MALLYEEFTKQILQVCFEVSNELGQDFWNRSIRMLYK